MVRLVMLVAIATAVLTLLCIGGGFFAIFGSFFFPTHIDGDLAGTVSDQGAPVAGARVVLVYTCHECNTFHDREVEVVSDPYGAFHFGRVLVHPLILLAFAERALSEPLALDLEADPAPASIELRLLPEGRISGQLLDGEGRPVMDREITVWTSAYMSETVTTDKLGLFELGGLPPGKAWLGCGQGGDPANRRVIQVQPGAVQRVELRLASDRARSAPGR